MGVPRFTIKGSTLFSIKGFAVVGLLTKKWARRCKPKQSTNHYSFF